MSQLALAEMPPDLDELIENLVTEDDEPVDNMLSEKQMRLLTEPLYASWQPPPSEEHPAGPRKFMAAANVGVFSSVHLPPVVPDMFLSLDVEVIPDWTQKKNRSYFIWEHDKPPEVAVEIVSNKVGGELGDKMRRYARMSVGYYVVFDPFRHLSQDLLRVYELEMVFGHPRYRRREDFNLSGVGLSLTLWRGIFETVEDEWLRWCDAAGNLIPTGKEYGTEQAQRADTEAQRADTEAQRAGRLAAKLRELGLDPNEV